MTWGSAGALPTTDNHQLPGPASRTHRMTDPLLTKAALVDLNTGILHERSSVRVEGDRIVDVAMNRTLSSVWSGQAMPEPAPEMLALSKSPLQLAGTGPAVALTLAADRRVGSPRCRAPDRRAR